MNIVLYLDWVALALGTTGTVLWAHNGKGAKYAGVWWFASAVLWMGYAYLQNLEALGVRDCINVLLYVYGAYRGLSKKKVQTADAAVPLTGEEALKR